MKKVDSFDFKKMLFIKAMENSMPKIISKNKKCYKGNKEKCVDGIIKKTKRRS